MATGTITVNPTVKLINGKSIYRVLRKYTNVAISAGGYVYIDSLTSIQSKYPAVNWGTLLLINMTIAGFPDGNVYGIARGSNAGQFYAIGKPSATISYLNVMYFFLNLDYDVYADT